MCCFAIPCFVGLYRWEFVHRGALCLSVFVGVSGVWVLLAVVVICKCLNLVVWVDWLMSVLFVVGNMFGLQLLFKLF